MGAPAEVAVQRLPRNRKGNVVYDPTEARMRAISDIVSALVDGVKAGTDVDLNTVKREVSLKYSLARAPKLVEIIAALPDEHRAELLPQYVPFALNYDDAAETNILLTLQPVPH